MARRGQRMQASWAHPGPEPQKARRRSPTLPPVRRLLGGARSGGSERRFSTPPNGWFSTSVSFGLANKCRAGRPG